MSEGEGIVLVMCVFAAGTAWAVWFWQAAFTAPRCSRFEHRWPLLLAPAVCAGVLYAVLKTFSSFDVRDDPVYQVSTWSWERRGSGWRPGSCRTRA